MNEVRENAEATSNGGEDTNNNAMETGQIAGEGFGERPTPPKFLTPEEKAEREASIKNEQENFTPDNFSADKELPEKPVQHIVLASKVIVSIPADVEDIKTYVNDHILEMTDRLLINLEVRKGEKTDDGVVRLTVDENAMNEAGQDEKRDDAGNMVFFLKEAIIDGVTRQVEFTVIPKKQ